MKGTTEGEMVGWHYLLDGHEFWLSLGSWWWTGKPGMLQSMGPQIVRHDWVTEMNWTCVVRSVDSGARLSGSVFWLLLSSYSTLGNLLKPTRSFRASLVSQLVKNPSATWETWVRSLSWEDPLEEDMATHSSVLAWRISMERGIWWVTIRPVTKSRTRLSYWAHSILAHLTSMCFSLLISQMEIIWIPNL